MHRTRILVREKSVQKLQLENNRFNEKHFRGNRTTSVIMVVNIQCFSDHFVHKGKEDNKKMYMHKHFFSIFPLQRTFFKNQRPKTKISVLWHRKAQNDNVIFQLEKCHFTSVKDAMISLYGNGQITNRILSHSCSME